MNLEIVISTKSGLPIYEQIVRQIRMAVMQGKLCGGDMLPSMRKLAGELHVSVITVQKAYEQMALEGLIVSAIGRGSMISPRSQEAVRQSVWNEIDSLYQQILLLAEQAGIEGAALEKRLKDLGKDFQYETERAESEFAVQEV